VATTISAGEPLQYPKTKRIDHFDVYHGVKVPCPYRWLEDDVRDSKEVAAWVEAENKVTDALFEGHPRARADPQRLTELWNFERYSVPTKAGKYYIYSKNDGLQNQSVVYVQDKLDGEAKVLLDPNSWSKDGTVALNGMSLSDDGKYVAYGVSEAGSDWVTWSVLETASGKKLADELKWTKFTDADWTPDNAGFLYVRYPEPKRGQTFQGLVFDAKLCYHKVGTPQSQDQDRVRTARSSRVGLSIVGQRGRQTPHYLDVEGHRPPLPHHILDLQAKDAQLVDLIDNFRS